MKASPFFNQETLKSGRLNRKSPFYRRKSSSDNEYDRKCPVRVSFEIIKRSRNAFTFHKRLYVSQTDLFGTSNRNSKVDVM